MNDLCGKCPYKQGKEYQAVADIMRRHGHLPSINPGHITAGTPIGRVHVLMHYQSVRFRPSEGKWEMNASALEDHTDDVVRMMRTIEQYFVEQKVRP